GRYHRANNAAVDIQYANLMTVVTHPILGPNKIAAVRAGLMIRRPVVSLADSAVSLIQQDLCPSVRSGARKYTMRLPLGQRGMVAPLRNPVGFRFTQIGRPGGQPVLKPADVGRQRLQD